MSEWMLSHVWGIRGYEVVRCQKSDPEFLAVTIRGRRRCCGVRVAARRTSSARDSPTRVSGVAGGSQTSLV